MNLSSIAFCSTTHASNEYRGWPYENEFCTCPGLDWRKKGDTWTHPRSRGAAGACPGDPAGRPRDVSTALGEDLAESVRYCPLVRDERAWRPPTKASRRSTCGIRRRHASSMSATTSYSFRISPWYRRLDAVVDARAANLAQRRNQS